MSVNLFIVRHGETDWNKCGRFQGSTDIPLNELGKQQAQQAQKKLSEIKFEKCFCSSLGRAQQTAEIICPPDTPIVLEPKLQELFCGAWEGKTDKELREAGDHIDLYFTDPLNYFPREGETIQKLYLRASSVVEEIINSNQTPDANYLIVSHGGTIRTILSYLVANSVDRYPNFIVENCGIAKVVIDSHGRKRIAKLNW